MGRFSAEVIAAGEERDKLRYQNGVILSGAAAVAQTIAEDFEWPEWPDVDDSDVVLPAVVLPSKRYTVLDNRGKWQVCSRNVAAGLMLHYDDPNDVGAFPVRVPQLIDVRLAAISLHAPLDEDMHDSRFINPRSTVSHITVDPHYSVQLVERYTFPFENYYSAGDDEEWKAWSVYAKYPVDALNPAMAHWHRERATAFEQLLVTLEEALENPLLNPVPPS